MTTPRTLTILLVVAGMACATTPPPRDLVVVEQRLESEEATLLAKDRPSMIEEARTYQKQARRAYEARSMEQSKWYAILAAQHVNAAIELKDLEAYETEFSALLRQDNDLAAEQQRLQTQQEEMERIAGLNQTIAGLNDQLAGIAAADRSAAAQAKQALLTARDSQAQAISQGAASHATARYEEGRVLIEAAVEAIRLELFAEAKAHAERSSTAFQSAINEADAERQALAQRAEEAGSLAKQSATAKAAIMSTREAEKTKAAKAIASAEQAEKTALAAGQSETQPALYNSGLRLLQGAEAAMVAGDFARSEQKAREAVGRFSQRSPPPATAQSNTVAANPALTSVSLRPQETSVWAPAAPRRSSLDRRVDERMVDLQLRQARALGRGEDTGCPGAFRESQALLTLAQQRRDNKDPARALEFVVLAEETLKRCDVSGPQTNLRSDESKPVGIAAVVVNPSNQDKEQAEQALEAAQLELAAASITLAGQAGLTQAAGLIRQAEQWLDRGAFARGQRLAEQARGILTQTQAQKTLDDKNAADQQRQAAIEEDRNQRAIVQDFLMETGASIAKVKAGEFDANAMAEAELNLKNARSWLAAGDLKRARAWAMKSRKAALASQQTGIERAKQRAAIRKATVDTVPAPKAPTAEKATVEAGPSRQEKAREIAETSLAMAQIQFAAARATGRSAIQIKEAELLLVSARQWLDSDAPERSMVMSRRAQDVLAANPVSTSSQAFSGATSAIAASTVGDAVTNTAAVTNNAEASQQRELRSKVLQAEILEQRLKDNKLTGETKRRAQRGSKFLTDARKALGKKDFLAAQHYADAAHEEMQAALRESETVVAVQADESPRIPESRSVPVTVAPVAQAPVAQAPVAQAPAPVVAKQDVGDNTNRSERPAIQIIAQAAELPDGRWQAAYDQVTEALILRDRTAPLIGEAGRERFDIGNKFIERARRAWKDESYKVASRLVEAAVEEYQAAAKAEEAAALKQKSEAAKQVENEESRKQAELQAAAALEKQRREAEAAQTRRKSEAEQKAEAEEARQEAVLKKQSASDALRAAKVSRDICEKKGCSKSAFAKFTQAKSDLEAAQDAFAAESWERSKALSEQAQSSFAEAQEAGPAALTFENARHVRVLGDRIVVDPKIRFASGSTKITNESGPALSELASLLKDNEALLLRLEVQGHTDNRGSRSRNTNLSKMRAQAVVDALTAAGVPQSKLLATGFGPDRPVQNNNTADGREANRRVEIRFELKN